MARILLFLACTRYSRTDFHSLYWLYQGIPGLCVWLLRTEIRVFGFIDSFFRSKKPCPISRVLCSVLHIGEYVLKLFCKRSLSYGSGWKLSCFLPRPTGYLIGLFLIIKVIGIIRFHFVGGSRGVLVVYRMTGSIEIRLNIYIHVYC